MKATTLVEQERAEMEQVLRSGIFEKAPRLGRFFSYICDRHFEGRADQIKEYSIALEALGRSPEFDPKKDSIVRVEAHRLRKRLDDFYKGPGAGHALRICIPNGQYRPHFLVQQPSIAPQDGLPRIEDTVPLSEPVQIEPTAPPLPGRRADALTRKALLLSAFANRTRAIMYSAVLVACFVIAAVVLIGGSHRSRSPVSTPGNEVWTGPPLQSSGAELRILAGYHGAPYVDRQGHTWQADAYYRGGKSQAIPADHSIEALPDPRLLKASRIGQFRYDVPLREGTYELHLLFAETEYGSGNRSAGGEGTRTFEVSVNGQLPFPSVDILADAGAANRLQERVLKDVTPAADGKLHLSFHPVSAPAMLSAIELLPSAPGRIHPVRIVAQANPVTDSDGRLWAADEYVFGGTSVFRESVVLDPGQRALYQGERYGNFTYRIPLAPGKYRVTLHFAEQWFGTPASHMAPLDSRCFNVFANGEALLRNFNVGSTAGGANRTLERVFDDVQPNAQGILQLEFVPVKNYAELNAIEVVETN